MDVLVKAIARQEPVLAVGVVDTAAVDRARTLHDTWPTATAALGRVMSGAVLLASLLKEGQRAVVQVAGDGPLRGVVAEADWRCRVRGYVKVPRVHLETRDGKPDVGRAIGRGFLNVIKDLGIREYYQGKVPLGTGEIASDLAYYLGASEQIPAAVSLGVFVGPENRVEASGGFLVHPLPGAGEETVAYLENRLGKIRPVSSLIREGMEPRQILSEAVGLPLDVLEERDVRYHCPCSLDRAMDAVIALGRAELDELARSRPSVRVECRFCRTAYELSREELSELSDGFEDGDGPEG